MTTAPKAAQAAFSLAALNMVDASDKPYALALLAPDGSELGVTVHVLGENSPKVTGMIRAAMNARRKAEAAAKIAAARRGADPTEGFIPVEEDVDFGQKMAAARIVGWDGIAEPYSPENALALCAGNPDIAAQIVAASADVANFMKVSPQT